MIALILGTRPEIIKFAPIVWELQKREIPFEIIHSGQHYSPNMDSDFFKELGLPDAIRIDHSECDKGAQTGLIMFNLHQILDMGDYSHVLVLGDTNTALAGCIAASKLNIPVAHIEAGLRSDERTLPEEQNRIMIDHNSDLWFPPTLNAYANLVREGIEPRGVYGNTIKDVVYHYGFCGKHNTDEDNRFALVTIHRQENTDNIVRLQMIITSLRQLSVKKNWDIYFPMHPRTKKALDAVHFDYSFIKVLEPVPLKKMLELEAAANVIITDSGGVQEEACIIGTPCITVRGSTERPEAVEIGANILVEPWEIPIAARNPCIKPWVDPYGDGHAAEKIVGDLCRK